MFHHSKMFKESTEEEELCNMKVRNCDIAEGRVQSLRVNDEAVAAVSSLRLGDLTSNLCPLNFVKPVSIRTSNKYFLVHKVTQSSPSPALCFVEEMPQDAQNSQITAFSSGDGSTKTDNKSSSSKTIRDVHISMRLMEDFLDLAKENTEKDLETCGILGAFLEKGTLYMTTLIIPKQESASSSCQATNEEEVFTILNQRSLFPVGWIHTHPSQSCFMSSVDLHTQYSYQVMIPEAFAIVLAPTDNSRSCGLFRITDPDGMNILRNCQEKGFHPHKEPDNGIPIYEHCSNVYKNSNLRFEIFDLR
ncbi:putative proteasome endopeptidase complex [Lupinus albus]|uniref:Putative proteasome endopeptidase complex n=1 Tax=Lupinus albus TaxID=3870 RepID=A0A6A4QI28_LUPAL|nr:putative proteasome endopeptidase complex [Lupinus albus]